jgi:hypothetical protein
MELFKLVWFACPPSMWWVWVCSCSRDGGQEQNNAGEMHRETSVVLSWTVEGMTDG